MGKWLTPDAEPMQLACRVLSIPLDPTWLAPVSGALLSLTYPWNWELHGVTTPEEAAARFTQMFNEYLDAGLSNCMIGVVFAHAKATAPTGALPCDGAGYLRVEYPNLYAALDPIFHTDADNFVVPDLTGRVVIGAGAGAGLSIYAVGQIGGEENHVLTVGELASHSHSDAGHSHSEIAAIATAIPPGEIPIPLPSATPAPSVTGTGFASIQSTGDSEGHNTIQPFEALKYAIWYK